MSLIEIFQILLILLAGYLAWQLSQGAPFLPTSQNNVAEALRLLNLQPGQTLYDLGSGDGRVLMAAAALGLNAIGFEINPLIVLISRWRLRKWRRTAKVIWGNALKKADFSRADGVYVFQSEKIMRILQPKVVKQMRVGSRIVSYGYRFEGLKAAKKVGALFVYDI